MNEKLEKRAKEVEEELNAEMGEGIKIETEKATYILLKSDGLKLHHAGYFIPLEPMRFAQLFYCFSLVKRRDEKGKEWEERKILPYIAEAIYNASELKELRITPLQEVDYIDLGETVAQIEKKTLGFSGLSTQLPKEVIEKVYRKELPEEPLKELRNLFMKVKEKLKVYVEQNETILDIGLCWAFATYWNEMFGVMPLLELIGVSGSGKTRFGTALCFIAKKGLGIADPTDANLTRIIDGFKPTLLIDDWDEVMRSHKKVAHSILKHVYKLGILVPRLTQLGKRFIVDMFSPYAPVIITTCEPITEPQLQRRLIELRCEKSTRQFPTITHPNTFFFFYFKEERQKLYELMFVLLPKIYETFQTLEVNLPSPYAEIWFAILTVAKLINEETFDRIYEYAKKITEEKEEEVYKDERLILEAIERLFERQTQLNEEGSGELKRLEFTVSELYNELKTIIVDEKSELSEREFERGWRKQKIGLILNRMGIKKGSRKDKRGTRTRVIERREFEEMCRKLGYIFTQNTVSDKSDMSDKLVGMRKEFDDEENRLKTPKNEGFEEVENASVCQKVVRLVRHVRSFLRLPEGYWGKCSYCGENKYLEWVDSDGNHLCDECKNEETSI